MKGRTGIAARAGRLLVLAWLLPVAGAAELPAGKTPASATAPGAEQQLDEVTVTATRTRPVRNLQTIIEWLARLVGQYRYEGSVELHAGPGVPAAPLPVRGVGDCVPFGLAPGVQCSIAVRWPEVRGENGTEVLGGISSLNPALILYGLDPDHRAIHYLQVDQKGIADGGLGYLDGDTLTTTAPCEGIPGNCQRITTINAQPDGKLIQMQIDIRQDEERTVRYTFVMRRLSQPAPGGASGKAQP